MIILGPLALMFLSAIPFYIAGAVGTWTDAVFESVSGWTTTGITVIEDVGSLHRALNLWRCATQWLGGLGSIMFFMVYAPTAAKGAFQELYSGSTGAGDDKVIPKALPYALFVLKIYSALTVMLAAALMIGGMDWLDALSHSFSCVSTGGFSTRTEGLAYYHSTAVTSVCALAAFLGGINYRLYYALFAASFIGPFPHRLAQVLKNSELRAYALVISVSALLLGFTLGGDFRQGLFLSAANITTTGLIAQNVARSGPTAVILFFMLFVGGCSGSSATGIKIIRWVILGKQCKKEAQRMLHPQGIFTLRMNGRPYTGRGPFLAIGYLCVFLIFVFLTVLAASACGAPFNESLRAALAATGNNQAALGTTLTFLGMMTPAAKWWFTFVMFAARFEFYPVLLFLYPAFWKR
jgi:trk system potassium uptake protein TrkH